jgi:hypothetical protein
MRSLWPTNSCCLKAESKMFEKIRIMYVGVSKVSGLAAWSENCKWYSSVPLCAIVSLFVSQSSEFCRHNPSYCFSTSVYCCKRYISLSTQSGNFWIHPPTCLSISSYMSYYLPSCLSIPRFSRTSNSA